MKQSKERFGKFRGLTERQVCKVCFKDIRPARLLELLNPDVPLCSSCFSSFGQSLKRISFEGRPLYYLSPYRAPLSTLLIQYKQVLDVELAPVFLSYYAPFLRILFSGYYLVLVPSSPSHLKKRGFDHLALIFNSLHLPRLDVLEKGEGKEQKHLGAEERKKAATLFKLKNGESVRGKKILLCDDVLTSGTSLRACLTLLERCSPKKVVLFVLMDAQVKE